MDQINSSHSGRVLRCKSVKQTTGHRRAESEGAQLNLLGETGSKQILNTERKRVQTWWGVEISASDRCILTVVQLKVHFILGYLYYLSIKAVLHTLLLFSGGFLVTLQMYFCNFELLLVADVQVLVLPKRAGGGHSCVCVCDSGSHNSKGSLQNLMKFALRLGDDWRMIWVTFGHVRGLDLVSGCGLIYKSGCNLKHHEIVAGVKGRWAFFRFYNSKAVCPGPGPSRTLRGPFTLHHFTGDSLSRSAEWRVNLSCPEDWRGRIFMRSFILHDDFELVVTRDLFPHRQ